MLMNSTHLFKFFLTILIWVSYAGPPVLSSAKLDLVFVLDNSGSMPVNDPKLLTRDMTLQLAKNLPPDARFGMVIFDHDAKLIMPLSEANEDNYLDLLSNCLVSLDFKGRHTNIPAGIERAEYELHHNARSDALKWIIFITDGIVDTGNLEQDREKTEWLKTHLMSAAKQDGIKIFSVAFSESADYELIQTLAVKTGGEYFRVISEDDLNSVFTTLTRHIRTDPVEIERSENEQSHAIPSSKPLSHEKINLDLESQPSVSSKSIPPHRDTRENSASNMIISNNFLGIVSGAALIITSIAAIIFLLKTRRNGTYKPSGKRDPIPSAVLIDLNNAQENYITDIDKPVIKIGRVSEVNDIVLPKETISKEHAQIVYKNKIFYVVDLRSRNGTRLNGVNFSNPREITDAPLKSGDRIQFDRYEFEFMLTDTAKYTETILNLEPKRVTEQIKQKKQLDVTNKIPTKHKSEESIQLEDPGWSDSHINKK